MKTKKNKLDIHILNILLFILIWLMPSNLKLLTAGT